MGAVGESSIKGGTTSWGCCGFSKVAAVVGGLTNVELGSDKESSRELVEKSCIIGGSSFRRPSPRVLVRVGGDCWCRGTYEGSFLSRRASTMLVGAVTCSEAATGVDSATGAPAGPGDSRDLPVSKLSSGGMKGPNRLSSGASSFFRSDSTSPLWSQSPTS